MKLNGRKLKEIIREEIGSMLQEDDPCWENYTMVGTKTVDGQEVPNCVPDDDVEDYDADK